MKRCPLCFAQFDLADYAPHVEAHHRINGTLRQHLSQRRTFSIPTERHAPQDACNCRAYGLRDYCELLKLEVI